MAVRLHESPSGHRPFHQCFVATRVPTHAEVEIPLPSTLENRHLWRGRADSPSADARCGAQHHPTCREASVAGARLELNCWTEQTVDYRSSHNVSIERIDCPHQAAMSMPLAAKRHPALIPRNAKHAWFNDPPQLPCSHEMHAGVGSRERYIASSRNWRRLRIPT